MKKKWVSEWMNDNNSKHTKNKFYMNGICVFVLYFYYTYEKIVRLVEF